MLAPLGHDVVMAASGRDALRCLLNGDYAVVLLDVNMPGMDGFETARLIRQRPHNRHTPLIFLTSSGDDVHAIEGYSLGAVDFIITPVVPEVLRSKVDVFLNLFEHKQEVRRQADRLLQRTQQLQALSQASMAIHRAGAIEQTLQLAVAAAREIVGAAAACVIFAADLHGMTEHKLVRSPDVAANGNNAPALPIAELRGLIASLVSHAPPQLTRLAAGLLNLPLGSQSAGPASTSILRAALSGRRGEVLGVLLVGGDRTGGFTDDDAAMLGQLAQIAATAVENTIYAQAREANRIKDEFLATLSHELRTPLSAIMGWAQMLRLQTLDAEETNTALEIIERNGQMQHKLIEDLLDVSRIVTGKMQLNVRPIDLADVVRAALDVVRPAAHAKKLTIEAALGQRVAMVNGDADRLQQVLWNLLSNAVKFTPEGGHIDLLLETRGGHAQIVVRDTGEGIEPEFLPFVFDRFRQADGSASRRHGGLGIGLSIVRHVLEQHGGEVWGESAGKGRGAAFFVRIPLRLGGAVEDHDQAHSPAATSAETAQHNGEVRHAAAPCVKLTHA